MKPSEDRLDFQKLEGDFLKQINTLRSFPLLLSRLKKLWQLLLKHLSQPTHLQVWHTYDQKGNIWWSAYDPLTRRSISQVSEDIMRVWIEKYYR